MKSTLIPTVQTLEVFEWLSVRGVIFTLSERGLFISPTTKIVGKEKAPKVIRVACDRLREIEALVSGKYCCGCASELAPHEQAGEPICLDCFIGGMTERPAYFRNAINDRTGVSP